MKGQTEVAASIRPRQRNDGRADRLFGIPNVLQSERIPQSRRHQSIIGKGAVVHDQQVTQTGPPGFSVGLLSL